jgi:hypothetical protein
MKFLNIYLWFFILGIMYLFTGLGFLISYFDSTNLLNQGIVFALVGLLFNLLTWNNVRMMFFNFFDDENKS